MTFLRVGVFSPTIYRIGGAELVAINMINALKQNGYEVIVSSNRMINHTRIREFYGKNTDIDTQIIFPFHLFPAYNHYNTYTLALQSYILKLNCDILIDVYGISPFPWSNIVYFQGSRILQKSSNLSVLDTFFLPYFKLFRPCVNLHRKMILANSKFKADFLREYFRQNELPVRDACIDVLYPPVATRFFRPESSDLSKHRRNLVITISRISAEKKLEIIPYIAKLTDKYISFIIVGSCHSKKTLYSILRLTKKLGVTERVKVLTDVPRNQLRALLWNSKVYLHTMQNEAFGIAIIEGMSSGCTPIVHNSGGPTEFVPKLLRYKSVAEAANKIEEAISKWTPKRAQRTCEIAERFDEKEFSRKFIEVVNSYAEHRWTKEVLELNMQHDPV